MGWLTNSVEFVRPLLHVRRGRRRDDSLGDFLSVVGLERIPELSFEDVHAFEETGDEAEPGIILEDGSEDVGIEREVKHRRVNKRPVEQVVRESGPITH